jgi:hypothetical protein
MWTVDEWASDLPYYEHPGTNQQTWTPPDGTDLDTLEAYVAAVDQQAERAGAASRPCRKNRRDRKRKGQEESAVAIAETSCRAAELSCCRGHRQDE